MLKENPSLHIGVIPNKIDLRDIKFRYDRVYDSAPFDWNIGFDVRDEIKKLIPNVQFTSKDQGTSGSCGGQALSYYVEDLEALQTGVYTPRSAKDPYSQIYQKGGGVAPRDVVNLACKKGVCVEKLIPSNLPDGSCNEQFMELRQQTPMTIQDALTALDVSYSSVKVSMDTIAQATRDNHGCIITIGGQDNGTWRTAYPQPAVKEEWSHYLRVLGAKMLHGEKHLIIKNSWGDNCGDHGVQYLNEGHITHISNCYTLVNSTTTIPLVKLTLMQQLLNLCYDLLMKIPKSFGYQSKLTV